MDFAMAVALGALTGIVGSLAPAALFERALRGGTRVSMGAGVASILASFFVLSAALLAVRLATDAGFVEYGCSTAAAFLVFWAVEAVRAWRAAKSGA